MVYIGTLKSNNIYIYILAYSKYLYSFNSICS